MANKNQSLEDQVAELRALVQDQATVIEKLQEGAGPSPKKEKEKLETPKETFSVDGKKYRFTVPKYIGADSNPLLAEEALKQPAELERLVAIESGVITLAGK